VAVRGARQFFAPTDDAGVVIYWERRRSAGRPLAHRRQDVRRIGALPTMRLEEAGFLAAIEEGIEEDM